MKWMAVTSEAELRKVGSFKEVSKEAKESIGHVVRFSGRGWKGLYESIISVQEIVNEFNEALGPKNDDHKHATEGYFASEAQEYMYYLLELDGDERVKKLHITPSLFKNKKKAKTWRDAISKKIHPDVNGHIKAAEAMSKLNQLYADMIGW